MLPSQNYMFLQDLRERFNVYRVPGPGVSLGQDSPSATRSHFRAPALFPGTLSPAAWASFPQSTLALSPSKCRLPPYFPLFVPSFRSFANHQIEMLTRTLRPNQSKARLKQLVSPDPCGLVGASSHKPKGHWSDAWLGHTLGLQVWSPVGACTRGNQLMFFLHMDVSLPPPFSKDKILKKKETKKTGHNSSECHAEPPLVTLWHQQCSPSNCQ